MVRVFIIFVLTLMAFISCEELSTVTDARNKLTGQWSCDEQSTQFKSAEANYRVYIDIDSASSNRIWIEGFYSIRGAEVSAIVNGNTITIPEQYFNGFKIVSGQGAINSAFDEISWEYEILAPDDELDQVTALYYK